jgi:hypothetical protein
MRSPTVVGIWIADVTIWRSTWAAAQHAVADGIRIIER